MSALLEICNKKRWGAPNFIIVHESGPDHQKNFLFKVSQQFHKNCNMSYTSTVYIMFLFIGFIHGFVYQVTVNDKEYQSSIASNNKKQAKAQCATACLQELGIVTN